VEPTAEGFVDDVQRLGADLRMRDLFALAKRDKDASPAEIQKLLRHPADDVRLGAVSIMDFQARDRKTGAERRRELYDLFIANHDRIDTWSMVDRAAPYVVGGYLWDKSREPLFELAR
jgi:3-methyladenine DNA glycosylase AlkD